MVFDSDTRGNEIFLSDIEGLDKVNVVKPTANKNDDILTMRIKNLLKKSISDSQSQYEQKLSKFGLDILSQVDIVVNVSIDLLCPLNIESGFSQWCLEESIESIESAFYSLIRCSDGELGGVEIVKLFFVHFPLTSQLIVNSTNQLFTLARHLHSPQGPQSQSKLVIIKVNIVKINPKKVDTILATYYRCFNEDCRCLGELRRENGGKQKCEYCRSPLKPLSMLTVKDVNVWAVASAFADKKGIILEVPSRFTVRKNQEYWVIGFEKINLQKGSFFFSVCGMQSVGEMEQGGQQERREILPKIISDQFYFSLIKWSDVRIIKIAQLITFLCKQKDPRIIIISNGDAWHLRKCLELWPNCKYFEQLKGIGRKQIELPKVLLIRKKWLKKAAIKYDLTSYDILLRWDGAEDVELIADQIIAESVGEEWPTRPVNDQSHALFKCIDKKIEPLYSPFNEAKAFIHWPERMKRDLFEYFNEFHLICCDQNDDAILALHHPHKQLSLLESVAEQSCLLRGRPSRQVDAEDVAVACLIGELILENRVGSSVWEMDDRQQYGENNEEFLPPSPASSINSLKASKVSMQSMVSDLRQNLALT